MASFALTNLKLIDYDLSKDDIALLSVPVIPVQFIFPFVVAKFLSQSQPLNCYIKSFPYRLATISLIAVFIYFKPQVINGKLDGIPMWYYATLATILIMDQMPF